MALRLSRTAPALSACAMLATLAIAQQPLAVPAVDPATLASVEGTTLGANRLPLSGVRVALIQQGPAPKAQFHEATSDALGKFAISGLDPGGYTLIASHDGFVTYNLFLTGLAAWHAGNQTGPAPTQPTLTAGQHMTDVLIEMSPLSVLSGKVTDEDGNPMPGVKVRPLSPASLANGNTGLEIDDGFRTDADGRYEVTVDPGRWYLRFSPPRPVAVRAPPAEPERAYVSTYYPGVHERSLASHIDAPLGQQVPELNVRFQKTTVYHVRGKVVGNFSPNLRMGVLRDDDGFVDGGTDGEGHTLKGDGTFDIAGLYPGAWTLILVPHDSFGVAGRQSVEIGNRDAEDVAIAIQPPADLTGSVKTIANRQPAVNPSQTPGTPLEVSLESLDAGFSFDATVQGDGSFTLKNVDVGRYRVDLTTPRGAFVKSVTFDGRECIDSGIDFAGGVRSSGLLITVSTAAGAISGAVVNPDGAPTKAVVTLVPDRPPTALYRRELYQVVGTGPSGQFILKNVVPGTYRVYAWERLDPDSESGSNGDPIVLADRRFPRLFDNLGAVVTVGENESKQVSLTLVSAAKMAAESRGLR